MQTLIVVTCLSTYYMCTKFQRNLKWVVIFQVEHLWNDPLIILERLSEIFVPSIYVLKVICRFGSPETLITDQGREFVNELSAKLYSITKTDHRITSAYHQQVNTYICSIYMEVLI